MSHWGFKTRGEISHADSPLALGRMRFEDYLTPRCLAALTDEQRTVLRIGRPFALDPAFADERERCAADSPLALPSSARGACLARAVLRWARVAAQGAGACELGHSGGAVWPEPLRSCGG